MDTKYTKSKYNINISHNKKQYIFNTFTKSLIEITDDICNAINNNVFFDSRNNYPIRKILEENGILVDSNRNEFEELIRIYNTYSNDNSFSVITIHTTLDCNFDCVYCIQKDILPNQSTLISSNEYDKILIQFFKNYLIEYQISTVKIIWSGGEPLMAWRRIKDLTNKMVAFCLERNIAYSAEMVSNGSLLTNSIATELKKYFIQSIQITLDGPPEIHNVRRKTKTGKGTFNQVLKGIINAAQIDIFITLRINIDKENIEFYNDFLNMLSKRFAKYKNVFISPERVVGNTKPGITNTNYTLKEFSCLEQKLKEDLKEYQDDFGLKNQRINLRCTAHHNYSLSIDNELNLFRCTAQTGHIQFSIGNIDKNGKINWKNELQDLEDNFEKIPVMCSTCRVMPLCMGYCILGGCSEEKSKIHCIEGCITSKYNIENKIMSLITKMEHAENPE